MFLPIKDDNPLVIIPWQFVTAALIVINILVFVIFQSGLFLPALKTASMSYGMIPAIIFDTAELDPRFAVLPQNLTLLTYMFLHGGWMHLLSNMAFLWVFGDNIEDAMGHVKFLVFYLLCGIAAGLAHALMSPDQQAPLIGASGAISGIIGAYLILHPRFKVWILLFGRLPLKIPAMFVLGGWVLLQIISLFGSGKDDVAWWAHLGGLAAGIILTPFFKRRGVALFDSNKPH